LSHIANLDRFQPEFNAAEDFAAEGTASGTRIDQAVELEDGAAIETATARAYQFDFECRCAHRAVRRKRAEGMFERAGRDSTCGPDGYANRTNPRESVTRVTFDRAEEFARNAHFMHGPACQIGVRWRRTKRA